MVQNYQKSKKRIENRGILEILVQFLEIGQHFYYE